MLFFKFIACLRIGNPILIQIIDFEMHRHRFNTEVERNNENESKRERRTCRTNPRAIVPSVKSTQNSPNWLWSSEEFATLEPGGSMWTSLESWHQAPSGDNPQNTYYLRSKASFEAGEEKSLARHERISSCGRNSKGYLKNRPGRGSRYSNRRLLKIQGHETP